MKQYALPLLVLAGASLIAAPVLSASPAASYTATRQDRFGAFSVVSAQRARLVGVTDGSSPADFLAMVEAHPGIRSLELIDCPGTYDDIANLRLGRMIRQHGITTIAPAGASVRSGAVDIFLAGSSRMAAPDARFSVHSWLSQDGRQASSISTNDPARAAYERYYRDMGLSDAAARAFYALTVSVPNNRTLDLAPRELGRFAKVTVTT
ncbi:MAG: hypothetical protein ACK4Z8_07955 [Novosphingobium sp.]